MLQTNEALSFFLSNPFFTFWKARIYQLTNLIGDGIMSVNWFSAAIKAAISDKEWYHLDDLRIFSLLTEKLSRLSIFMYFLTQIFYIGRKSIYRASCGALRVSWQREIECQPKVPFRGRKKEVPRPFFQTIICSKSWQKLQISENRKHI